MMEPNKSDQYNLPNRRREFFKISVSAFAFPFIMDKSLLSSNLKPENVIMKELSTDPKSIIGGYGKWAASLIKPVPSLSFRNPNWKDLSSWYTEASAKTAELIACPARTKIPPKVTIDKKYAYDGLEFEEISWQLPYGRRTKAIVLKPQGATGPLPAILGLHDHAGKKYFGYRKIVRTSDDQHPLLNEHQATDYDGKAWANEIARKGYLVMVHDAFTFGSRRVFYEDIEGLEGSVMDTTKRDDADPEKSENIEAYNLWATEHEHVMAKSLFCSGTTWPGVFLSEDQAALDILSARKDVLPDKIGCGGLSGGGLRTVYLAGMDTRIKCAVCVGFMTTWQDLVLSKSFTHTWMTFTPLLPSYIDFPEILGLRVPLPTLVQNNNQDELYTLSEMKNADQILREVFEKAGASDKYEGKFYDGSHKFDTNMQTDAFNWFDKWLK